MCFSLGFFKDFLSFNWLNIFVNGSPSRYIVISTIIIDLSQRINTGSNFSKESAKFQKVLFVLDGLYLAFQCQNCDTRECLMIRVTKLSTSVTWKTWQWGGNVLVSIMTDFWTRDLLFSVSKNLHRLSVLSVLPKRQQVSKQIREGKTGRPPKRRATKCYEITSGNFLRGVGLKFWRLAGKNSKNSYICKVIHLGTEIFVFRKKLSGPSLPKNEILPP